MIVVRLVLPDELGRGHITVQVRGKDSVAQLKHNALLQVCKKRAIVGDLLRRDFALSIFHADDLSPSSPSSRRSFSLSRSSSPRSSPSSPSSSSSSSALRSTSPPRVRLSSSSSVHQRSVSHCLSASVSVFPTTVPEQLTLQQVVSNTGGVPTFRLVRIQCTLQLGSLPSVAKHGGEEEAATDQLTPIAKQGLLTVQEQLRWRLQSLEEPLVPPSSCGVTDREGLKKWGTLSKLNNTINLHRTVGEKIQFHYGNVCPSAKLKKPHSNCLVVTTHRFVQVVAKNVVEELSFRGPIFAVKPSTEQLRLHSETLVNARAGDMSSVLLCYRTMEKDGDRMFTFTSSEQVAKAAEFLATAVRHCAQRCWLSNQEQSVARLVPALQSTNSFLITQQKQLTTWARLLQSIVCSKLFAPLAAEGYRTQLRGILERVTKEHPELYEIRLEAFQLPETAEETPILAIAPSLGPQSLRKVGELGSACDPAMEESVFDFIWVAPSFLVRLNVKAQKKLGIRPQMELQIGALRVEGCLRFRAAVFKPIFVSFAKPPDISFDIMSNVKMGKVHLPFQKQIETKIAGTLRSHLLQALSERVVGDKWLKVIDTEKSEQVRKSSVDAPPAWRKAVKRMPRTMILQCRKANICIPFQLGVCLFEAGHTVRRTTQHGQNEQQAVMAHRCGLCSHEEHGFHNCPDRSAETESTDAGTSTAAADPKPG